MKEFFDSNNPNEPKFKAMVKNAIAQYEQECTLDGAIKRAINQSGDFSQSEKTQAFWKLYKKIEKEVLIYLAKKKKPIVVSTPGLIRQARLKQLQDEKRAGDSYEEADIAWD